MATLVELGAKERAREKEGRARIGLPLRFRGLRRRGCLRRNAGQNARATSVPRVHAPRLNGLGRVARVRVCELCGSPNGRPLVLTFCQVAAKPTRTPILCDLPRGRYVCPRTSPIPSFTPHSSPGSCCCSRRSVSCQIRQPDFALPCKHTTYIHTYLSYTNPSLSSSLPNTSISSLHFQHTIQFPTLFLRRARERQKKYHSLQNND